MKPYYENDGITIYHGDCREILPTLPKADVVLTDPPYGMNKDITGDGADFLDAVAPALVQSYALLREGGSLFVFTAPGQVLRVGSAVGQPLRRLMWMYKPADICFPYYGWLQTSEAILWFSNGKPVLQDRTPFAHDCYVIRRQVNDEGKTGHPTTKPWEPIADIVSRCPVGGTVLDPFLGSGTTAKAAKFHGRRCIGIEIEERYCEIAAKRLSQGVLGI